MRNVFKKIIENLFIPTKLDYARPFSWGWLIIIVLVFLSLFVLGMPPIVKMMTSSVLSEGSRAYLIANKDSAKVWLGFSSLTFELLIAILLGQILLTEPIAQRLKRIVADSQVKQQLALQTEISEEESRLKRQVDEVFELLHDKSGTGGPFSRAAKISVLTGDMLVFLYPGMRRFYKKVIILSLITNFPGGLYGLGAFVLFVLLSLTKVGGIYLDSPWFK